MSDKVGDEYLDTPQVDADVEFDDFEVEYTTHPLAVASVAILAFLALLHTVSLPVAALIARDMDQATWDMGPIIMGYIIGSLISAFILYIAKTIAAGDD